MQRALEVRKSHALAFVCLVNSTFVRIIDNCQEAHAWKLRGLNHYGLG